jgi:hypothetical protein
MQEIKKIAETAGKWLIEMPKSVVSENFENYNLKFAIFDLYLQL